MTTCELQGLSITKGRYVRHHGERRNHIRCNYLLSEQQILQPTVVQLPDITAILVLQTWVSVAGRTLLRCDLLCRAYFYTTGRRGTQQAQP